MLPITFPQWDQDLFLYLNSKNAPWLDPIMYAISTYAAWAFVFLLIVAVMVYRNRHWGKWAAVFLVMGLATNSIVNTIVKVIVMRPRPGNYLGDIVHQLGKTDLSYSFFSAHSSNSICLALFATLYFRNRYAGIALFAWAIIVAYSRIYVGRHYPIDIMCGILFGLFTGWLSYWVYNRFYLRKTRLERN